MQFFTLYKWKAKIFPNNMDTISPLLRYFVCNEIGQNLSIQERITDWSWTILIWRKISNNLPCNYMLSIKVYDIKTYLIH